MKLPARFVEADPSAEMVSHPTVEPLAYMDRGQGRLRLTWSVGPTTFELDFPVDLKDLKP